MNERFTRYSLIIILACAVNNCIYAQQDSIPELPADEVEVLKNFRANVLESYPLFQAPKLETLKRSKQTFEYQIELEELEFEAPVPQIRPLAFEKQIQREFFDGFIDLSMGTPKSPKLEAAYQYNIEDWFELGLLSHYFSADDDVIESRDMESFSIETYGSYHLSPAVELKADVEYASTNRYFFSEPWIEKFSEQDSLKRTLDQFKISSSLNFDLYEKYKFLAELGFKYAQSDLNNFGVNEDIIDLFAQLDKQISDQSNFHLGLSYSFYTTDEEDFEFPNDFGLIGIAPHFNLNKDNWRIKLGGALYKQAEKDPIIQPDFSFSYTLSNGLDLKLGSRSEYNVFDLEQILAANPFKQFNNTVYETQRLVQNYLGFGYTKNSHHFGISASYNLEDKLPYFIGAPDFRLSSLEFIESDDYFSSQLGYSFLLDDFSINLLAVYNFRQESKALFPAWDLELNLSKDFLDDKITFDLNTLFRDKQSFVFGSIETENEALIDLNAKVSFKVLNRLSLYAEASNVLDRSYQAVLNYPSYGRNYRAGFLVKF